MHRDFCWQNNSQFFCFVVGEPVVVILATQVFLHCNIYKFELNYYTSKVSYLQVATMAKICSVEYLLGIRCY